MHAIVPFISAHPTYTVCACNPYLCFLPDTPDVLLVGDALAEPLGVGLLEVLEEDVGVVDMVNTARSVG